MRPPPLYDDVHAWLADSAQRLGVDGGCFHLKSRAGERIVCQAITDSYAATHLGYSLDLSSCAAIRETFRTGDLLSVDNAEVDGRVAPIARQRFGLKSVLYCPVRLTELPDAVAVFSNRRPHGWTDSQRQLAADLASNLEAILASADPGPSTNQSTYELMLDAVPGIVHVVDERLLIHASSGSVRIHDDGVVRGITVSVDELLRSSDRGHELRSALLEIIDGQRDAFQGLFRTERGVWWVHVRRSEAEARRGPLAVVHIQPMPAASRAVLLDEERNRLEALGRIAGSVAHEVNNALQHITLGIDEMSQGSPAHSQERALIRSAASRARRVTKQLLTFARRGPGRLEHRELTELIHDKMDLARRSVGADHHVSLRLRGRAAVRVDPRKIELVLINLCRNAADVSPSGSEVTIEVGAQNVDGEDRGILAVIDSGPGVPPEIVDNLGDLQVSTKTEELGTGFGLVVVKQVADEHGGKLVVTPGQDGRGARVALHLPMLGVHRGSANASAVQGPHVLIVDDEVELTNLLARALGSKGYATKRCWSLALARACFDADPGWPDLLLFDINLGDGSGIELYEHVRRARPELSCLAISGLVDLESAPGLVAGGCPILSKPFSTRELWQAVARALEQDRTDPPPHC